MAAVVSAEEVDFNFLQEKVNLTDGNLASHLRKLEDAGYVKMRKTFLNRRPRTIYTVTKAGKTAFVNYVSAIERIIKDVKT
jgi:DNA-binding MarR family transcriptional regulator